jgi:hypothetical protein
MMARPADDTELCPRAVLVDDDGDDDVFSRRRFVGSLPPLLPRLL